MRNADLRAIVRSLSRTVVVYDNSFGIWTAEGYFFVVRYNAQTGKWSQPFGARVISLMDLLSFESARHEATGVLKMLKELGALPQ